MSDKKMLLVETKVLPEVFSKVVEAKLLLASGEAKTASEAAKKCNISRSAFYKYKDSVFEYNHHLGKILSLHAVLRDKAGVLSKFLSVLYENSANILTVNQGLPASGVASVSVSLRVSAEDFDISGLLSELTSIKGVVSVKQIIGG